MSLDHWTKGELAGQRWRRWTPITVIANLCTTVLSSAVLMGITAYSADRYIKDQDAKLQIMVAETKEIKDKENRDMLCLTRQITQCCGEKANVNC